MRHLALLLALSAFGFITPTRAEPVPRFKKVLWIWTENTPYATLINQKYLRALWQRYPSVRLSHVLPVSAVTQANSVAMIAGFDQGVTDNELTRLQAPTIIDLLESHNIPWRVYGEDYPGACYPGEGSGYYKRYRMPFISIAKVQSDRYLCSKIVSFRNFDEDLRSGQVPSFAVLIPNLKSSGALNPLDAESGLRKILDPILDNQELLTETTIFITTTTNTDPRKPELYTMILGAGIPTPAQTVDTPYTHYHLLRTIEDGLELGHLGQHDAEVTPVTGFWNKTR